MRQILFILLLFVSGSSYGQIISLEGHWRRIHPSLKNVTKDKAPKYGDFIFKRDSTFTIVGDSTAASSEIPGWHVGEEVTGKWSHAKSSLCLQMQGYPIPLCYKVLTLTSKELVLVSAASGRGKMKFIRL